MKKIFLFLFLAINVTACITVESISINQIPAKAQRRNKVYAESWSPIIIGIPFGSAFVDEARADLLNKCRGKLEGVLKKLQHQNYFLGLYITQNVILEGYCTQEDSKHHAYQPDRSDAI